MLFNFALSKTSIDLRKNDGKGTAHRAAESIDVSINDQYLC